MPGLPRHAAVPSPGRPPDFQRGSHGRGQPVHLTICPRQLVGDKLELADDDLDMGDGRFGSLGRDDDGQLPQALQDFLSADGSHAMALEELLHGGQAEASGFGGRRREHPQIEHPGPGQIALDLEKLGKIAPELLSQAVHQAGPFTGKVVGDARPLAKLDHFRRVRIELAEEAAISAQRIGQREDGVTPSERLYDTERDDRPAL